MGYETKVNILTTNNAANSFSFIFPLLVNKERLLERGVKISIFCSLSDRLFKGDVLFVDSKFFKYWWQDREDGVYRFLDSAKKRFKATLWFDTSDSTGTTNFQVMPYIDGYYKNQILKDKTLYLKRFYRDRIFFDYYHRIFGIHDEGETGCECPIDTKYMHKIDISWNQGLNDHSLLGSKYNFTGNITSRLRRFSPFRLWYTLKFVKIDKPRKLDIAARLGFTHPRKIVRFHREMLLEKLKRFNVNTGFISHTRYYNELKNAKLSISPFGLGEFCYRDFETIICGALLIKPDVSHLETWPDLYKDNQTYVKCNWDFSDIEERIEDLLSHPEKIRDIALEAQRNYRYYLFGPGRIDFCDRVREIVQGKIN